MKDFYQFFSGKRVWLSGGTGFKGAWLTECLIGLQAEVFVYSLPPPTEISLFDQLGLSCRIDWQNADIRDSQKVLESITNFQPDFVFHLAAQPLVRLSYSDPAGTYQTNVLGTIHVLEALRNLKKPCGAVFITTDKCYENREWLHSYREEDSLGGHDPYSSSKAACEIAIASWRRSFFHDHPVRIASGRAGNVIGGGDWAMDRILPDCIRALSAGVPIPVRNRYSTRPWQHVLEPLSGYLQLAARLAEEQQANSPLCSAFNFGPNLVSNRSVIDVVEAVLKHWPGAWRDQTPADAPHEAGKLNLTTDKAFHLIGWQPRWDFENSIKKTVEWYRAVHEGADPSEMIRGQIKEYFSQ